MFDIKVERVLDKSIESVFEALIDHANYQNFPGVNESKLLVEGDTEKNGKGALRKIGIGPLTLFERIVGFERPNLLQYKIEYATPFKFDHEMGQIRLFEEQGKTRVVWTSKGTVKVFLLGPLLLDRAMQSKGGAGFGAILKAVAKS